jgi:DNA-binding MarR family transcriptional regulator
VASALERRAAQALWVLLHRSRGRMRQALAEHGLTPPQALLLRAVAEQPGISPGELARLSGVTPATATGSLDLLEARGLLRRARRQDDRRVVRLELTPAGRRFGRTMAEAGTSAMAAELRGLDARELRSLVALLEKLAPRAPRRRRPSR